MLQTPLQNYEIACNNMTINGQGRLSCFPAQSVSQPMGDLKQADLYPTKVGICLWAERGSNPRPRHYECPALTTELSAREVYSAVKTEGDTRIR
jgi:hypothetical protein